LAACPRHRVGFPGASVGVAEPLKVANVPVAVVAPSVPGALLRVKLRSLKACPALLIRLAASVSVIVTERRPLLVVKSALAESAPSLPVPLPKNVIVEAPAGLSPRALSQELLVIRRNHKTGEVSLDPLRWGLIPYWCQDPTGGRRPINAKYETVWKLPTFHEAYRKRRCIELRGVLSESRSTV